MGEGRNQDALQGSHTAAVQATHNGRAVHSGCREKLTQQVGASARGREAQLHNGSVAISIHISKLNQAIPFALLHPSAQGICDLLHLSLLLQGRPPSPEQNPGLVCGAPRSLLRQAPRMTSSRGSPSQLVALC